MAMLMLSKYKSSHVTLAAFLYALFALFLIWPIWQVVATAFTAKTGGFGLQYVALIFYDPLLVSGLFNAIGVALTVTFITLLISLPLAILTVRYDFPGRGLLSGLLLAPLVLPPFVGAIGLRLVLGRVGPLSVLLGQGHGAGIDWLGGYRLAGMLLVESLHLYPVLLLNLQAALANIDPAMEQAAENLGAGRWTTFTRITLPLLRPGLFAGCTLTMIWSFTELGTPLVFNFYTITPVQIFELVTDVSNNPLPFALVVVTLIASGGLYLVGKVLLGRGADAATSKAITTSAPRRLHGLPALAAAAAMVIIFLLAILPHMAVILTSVTATGQWYRSILPQHYTLDHFRAALGDETAIPSVLNSIRYATMATVLATIVGLAAAILIVRTNLPGRGLLDALAMLPLAVPGLVLAFGYLAISVSLKHHFGDRLPVWLDVQEYPVVFLIIAYAARRIPYVVRSAAAGLEQSPRDLELAAENLGAGRFSVLTRITIPLIGANLIAGALLAFAFTMLEVSDSLVLAQREGYFPITKAIVELSERLGDGHYIACALGVWAMILLALTLLSANSLLGKRMGAAFRI
jgi:iron(III) transport system permease protein